MAEYVIAKYWKGPVAFLLLLACFLPVTDTFDDAMLGTTGMFCLGWTGKLFVAADKNPRKATMLAGGLFGLPKLVWYVVTLKPLRRWLFRLFYVGPSPKPYPYLALYGSLLDTHMMMYKMSTAFFRDKTPAARAALWRLLARGDIQIDNDGQGKAMIRLCSWTDSPSDGLDQDLEHSLYTFLSQSASPTGGIDPDEVLKAMTYYENEDIGLYDLSRKKGKQQKSYDKDNQFRFADLLNTGISLKAYTRRDVQNIFGMKRFLEGLPKTYDGSRMPQLRLVWKEYMTYAYLFGIERQVLRRLSRMMDPDDSEYQLLQQLCSDRSHLRVLKRLMNKVSRATPAVEDSVSGHSNLLPIAWHHEEIYDL